MKKFREYLTESAKEYSFRLKFADLPDDFNIEKLEIALEKYELKSLSKPKKTPIQEHPLDFQTLQNADVSIVDATVSYPVTPAELHNYLSFVLRYPASHMVVINKDHPEEIAREEAVAKGDEEYESLLDTDYAKSDIDHDDYYGDNYNKKLVNDLVDDSMKDVFATKPGPLSKRD
jgi:hypothetical protein